MKLPLTRRPAVLIGVAFVATLIRPVQAPGAPPQLPRAAPPNTAHGPLRAPVTVTLITGDKVTVSTEPDGSVLSVDAVKRPPGATGSVRTAIENGHTYVYPDEAMAYLATDRLDKQLFDVTQLIAQGYDDAHSSELPLIVTRTKDSATPRSDAAEGPAAQPPGVDLPGAKTTLSLPSVRGAAVRAQRSKSAVFWSTLTGTKRQDSLLPTARSGEAADAAPSFVDGVGKVWLDGKARAALADSTAQIGAPAAWTAGGTGTGVRVAVLDSGVDPTHPDLVNRIVGSKNFVRGEDIIDRAGHGTHTASTVAGTGAASDGKERGVAPDADLLVGKVLGNDGSGPMSGIIAGMEWAARTEHAKVINMSLGTPSWRTQDDPLSQAVNRLSAETGALFVIAAGNTGNGPYSVSAPGTADAALTVGAVDSSDHLAGFSAAGPRMDDDGLKPDLTAPGVDVLAARSQYTMGGEGFYLSESGTSMAAPHVAGAAVLLAQKHPEWTGQQIKDALMSSSVPTPDYSPYQAGAGRLNVAAAYHQDQVIATGSVDAGLVRWSTSPQRKQITREITYTNTTDEAVALALSADPGESPAGVFTPAADSVTVPAGGSATVDIVVDPNGLAPGQYAAQVTARYAAGEVHTAVGVSVESERYDLTIHLKDHAGRPMSGDVEITDASGKTTDKWVQDGTLTSRWAPGSYTAVSAVEVEGRHGPHSLGFALLTVPEFELTADRDLVLDASQTRQVKVATPKPTTVVDSRLDVYRSFTSSEPTPSDQQALHEIFWPSATYDSLWALPTKDKVTKGSFVFTTRIRAKQTPLKITYGGRNLDDALVVQPGSPLLPDGTTRLDAVFAGTGSPADYTGLSARGKAVVVRAGATAIPTDQAAAAHAAGAAMLLVVNDGDGRWSDWYGSPDGTTGQIPVASVTMDEGEALIKEINAAGKSRVELTVEAHPAPKYLYDLVDYHKGGVPNDPSPATDPRSLARIDLDFAPPHGEQVIERREDSPQYEYGPASNPHAVWGMVRVARFPQELVAPGRRTDWVSAGPGIKWQQYAYTSSWWTNTDVRTYQPGSVQKDRWFGPLTRPRLTSAEIPFRGGPGISMFITGPAGDGGSAHNGYSSQVTGTFSLYQGDKLLTQYRTQDAPSLGYWGLEPQKLPYRLVADTRSDASVDPYSTTTHTEWSFTSGASEEGDAEAIPLAQLDYGTDLDPAGRAKRTSDFSITPEVLGSDSAQDAVSSLTLEVSYDDGATWHRQDLREKNGTWKAALNAPHQADYVSIRVTARQRNGGGITQTVTRAFGLR